MVVQHNLTAMNSNRMLGLTQSTQAKSTEKLSSGYRINRAADDAAGLSISEKMRKQIRGLTQASTNAQDGISAVQTAEGALNEVQDMLQRMNELAVKAANGTNSEDDRSYIQNEIDQLTTEIDRVSETTKFNETYLLKGNKDASSTYYTYKTYDSAQKAELTFGTEADSKNGAKISSVEFEDSASAADQNAVAKLLANGGIKVTATATATADAGDGVTVAFSNVDFATAGSAYSFGNFDSATGKADIMNGTTKVGTITINGTAAFTNSLVAGTAGTEIMQSNAIVATGITKGAYDAGAEIKYYDKDGNGIPSNALTKYFSGSDTLSVISASPDLYDAAGVKIDKSSITAADAVVAHTDLPGSLQLKLHVGADATSNNQIGVNIDAMSAKGLGVNGLRVDGKDDTNALNAIETIKESIQKVSTQRSALGAVQNRLEHTINNLDNVVENTTSAESAIRDTDMATEMVKYSNNNILAQAGQAMLAQANQSNQGVLSLLG